MRKLGMVAAAVLLSVAFAQGAASAKGTMKVQQADGSVQVYNDVEIRAGNKQLKVTTADGKGTLRIDRAACQTVGELLRCLPYDMILTQNGKTYALDFQQGVVYVNKTKEKHNLPLSSTSVPPNGILMGISTKIGTFASMTGTIDGAP